jgi:hypothetical protein
VQQRERSGLFGGTVDVDLEKPEPFLLGIRDRPLDDDVHVPAPS